MFPLATYQGKPRVSFIDVYSYIKYLMRYLRVMCHSLSFVIKQAL